MSQESYNQSVHGKYQTIGHEHLEYLVNWATGEYPKSGLCLVECQDGRWFLEVDFGDAFDNVDGVANPKAPDKEPKFFNSETDAQSFAINVLQLAHPELLERTDLARYFELD